MCRSMCGKRPGLEAGKISGGSVMGWVRVMVWVKVMELAMGSRQALAQGWAMELAMAGDLRQVMALDLAEVQVEAMAGE